MQKKIIALVLMLGLILVASPGSAPPANAATGDITVAVNGNVVSFPDQKPYIDSANRTLVPVRFPAESLGDTVDWNGTQNLVTVTQTAHEKLPDALIKLTVGKKDVLVNNATQTMDTVPVITNSRTMVPLRFVSEYLGADVVWWDATKTVHVFTQGQTAAEQQAIIDKVTKELGQTPTDQMLSRTIGADDTMFILAEWNPSYVGTSDTVANVYGRDKTQKYRWECANYPGMNSFHTTVYSTGQAVTEPKGEEFVQNFRFCGKGYDTTLKSGMLLTYNVYDSNNKLIRIVDFQL